VLQKPVFMQDNQFITVTILEDEKNFRESAALLLNSSDDIRCIKAYDGLSAFLKDFKNVSPDIFWLDLNLLDGSGIEALQQIKTQNPNALCLICSFFDNEEKIFEALKNGADGYLIKGEKSERILESIRELYDGGAPMSRVIAKKVLSYFNSKPKSVVTSLQEQGLSKREIEILHELSKGLSYNEIAEATSVSLNTIKSHLHRIYTKLHVSSKTEAVIKFMNQSKGL